MWTQDQDCCREADLLAARKSRKWIGRMSWVSEWEIRKEDSQRRNCACGIKAKGLNDVNERGQLWSAVSYRHRLIRRIPSSQFQWAPSQESEQSWSTEVSRIRIKPVGFCLRRPPVPKHPNCNKGTKEHHDAHPIFRLSDTIAPFCHVCNDSVIRASHNDHSGEETDTATNIGQSDQTFTPAVDLAEDFWEAN